MAEKKKPAAAPKPLSPKELAKQERARRQAERKAANAAPKPRKTPPGMTTTEWKKLRKEGLV